MSNITKKELRDKKKKKKKTDFTFQGVVAAKKNKKRDPTSF
jgi:hypothetical protein